MYQNKSERIFTEQDFRSILVNRSEIERVLGMVIELQKNNDVQYLEDYALFPELNLHDVVCIFLGLHPKDWNANEHPRYETIYNAIQQLAEKGEIKATVEKSYGSLNVRLPHDTAKAIAKSYGFSWTVPPYKEITLSDNLEAILQTDNSEQINALQRQLDQANAKNAELIAELEHLRAENQSIQQAEKTDIVNFNEYAIHGHKSDNFEIIFKISKIISEKCDVDNPHSYPSKPQITEYVKRLYSDSNKLAEAVYQIVIPEKVKSRGAPPKGVNTFQGFI